jgi:dTDP-4-dehydrorhamnose reductase
MKNSMGNKMKIAITGSSGLVGSRIVELLENDFEFIPLLSKELNITDKDAVHSTLSNINYDLLLHLAAYTNVDKAETERDLAYKVNVDGTSNLYNVTQSLEKKFIFISTEFVFDGSNPPYDEDSKPNPTDCVYGKSKYEAEQIVKENSMIVRIQNPYRASFEPKKDFMRVLKWLLEQGRTLQMVEDSYITPTFIDDIAYSLKYLMTNFSPEIFHIVGSESMSPFQSGKLIAKTFDLDQNLVQPTTFEKYFEGKARRPQWAKVISKKNTFHKMTSFEEGLLAIKNMLQ